MSVDETAQARQELAELRRVIHECRSDLGIASREPAPYSARRAPMLRLRGLRRARRRSPVA
jgi:hypothetical protein